MVQANGVAPTPRYEHVASVLKDRYICIFGGGSSRGWHNDIIIFDTGRNKLCFVFFFVIIFLIILDL